MNNKVIAFTASAVTLAIIGVGISHFLKDEEKHCWVRFDSNGGERIAPISVVKGSKIDNPNAKRKGYGDVEAWFLNNNEWDFANDIVTNDILLKATWGNPLEYNITYEFNGGEVANENPTKYTVEDEIVFNSCYKNGYQFNGWVNTANNCYQSKIEKGTIGDIDLSASFQANTYKVHIVTNRLVDFIIKDFGATTDSIVNFTYQLYSGYCVNSVSSDDVELTHDAENQTLSFKMPSHDVYINASTSLIQYTVTYHDTYGTNNPNRTTYTVESGISVTGLYGRKGYTFVSWLTESGNVFTGGMGITGNLDLYATWSKDTYKITYDLDGGTNDSRNPSTYDVDSEITLYAPTKEGYEFKEWTNNYGDVVTTIGPNETGDVTLYASWNKICKLTLIYEDNGEQKTTEYKFLYNTKYTLTYIGNKYGYYIEYWYEKKDNDRIMFYVGNSIDIWYDRTLYASYFPYTCYINFYFPDTNFDYQKFYNDALKMYSSIGGDTTNLWFQVSVSALEAVESFPIPEKDGYEFLYWVNADNEKVTSIPKGWDNQCDENHHWCEYKLYPMWKAL